MIVTSMLDASMLDLYKNYGIFFSELYVVW